MGNRQRVQPALERSFAMGRREMGGGCRVKSEFFYKYGRYNNTLLYSYKGSSSRKNVMTQKKGERMITESPCIGKRDVSEVLMEGLVLDKSRDSSRTVWEGRQSMGDRCRHMGGCRVRSMWRALLIVFSQKWGAGSHWV